MSISVKSLRCSEGNGQQLGVRERQDTTDKKTGEETRADSDRNIGTPASICRACARTVASTYACACVLFLMGASDGRVASYLVLEEDRYQTLNVPPEVQQDVAL